MKIADLRKSLKSQTWHIYILECSDGSFYCGVTTSLNRRINEHNSGKGAKYTRGRTPVKLLVSIEAGSQSAAQRIEAAVKKQRKDKKINFLISQGNQDT